MKRVPPCVMVIFGATGDLTKGKLIPALYNLAGADLLPENFAVVGLGRKQLSTEEFCKRLGTEIQKHLTGTWDPKLWEWFLNRLYYLQSDIGDPATYLKLKDFLGKIDGDHGVNGSALFYFATAPKFFSGIVQHLGSVGLIQEEKDRWRRVIIEKPFGRDLESARELNRTLQNVLSESQIYRIDHYLGKETVQNILVFRFANGIFEPIWNRRYIDHVQITVAEDLGIENRGNYYEESGALRDMLPNHLFQLLALTAMEPPISFEAEAVRSEKAKIFQAVHPIPPEEVLNQTVRGQYGEGKSADGQKLPAYRSEPKVAPDSKTETFTAIKLMLDNWRWAGVPFYLRTGKRLVSRVSEITIQFKQAPLILFRDTPVDHLSPNILVLRIQPKEGIWLSFGAKIPGLSLRIGAVNMDFCYTDYFKETSTTGYEILLYDCMNGDATLFQRGDHAEAAWNVVTPILDVWNALPPREFPNYSAGSWGPAAADNLLARDGRMWRKIE